MRRLTALVDRAALRATVARQGRSRVQSMTPTERLEALAELEAVYNRDDWIADPDAFFGTPSVCMPGFHPQGHQHGRDVLDLSWSSDHETHDPHVGESYARFEHNTTVHARWYKSPTPRPTVLTIHGYGGGGFRRERLTFPVRRWLNRGMDVVLFTLPFHGARRAPGDKLRFPSALPPVTIEGFRQAIGELRELIGLLKDEGVPDIAVVGMSLGGYTASLLATVDDRPSFVLPIIPLASLADYALRHGRMTGTPEEQQAVATALDRVYRVVSPLGRPPKLDPEQVLVAGGVYDRICPMDQAEQLAEHFQCQLVRFKGGHLVQIDRGRAWDAMDERLYSLGVL